MSGSHSAQGPAEGVHVLQHWSVADASVRTALSVTADQVGKVLHQQSDDTWWLLVDDAPLAWRELAPSASGGSGAVNVSYVTSPTAADYYQAAAGVGDGSADFLVAVWLRSLGPTAPLPANAYGLALGGKWQVWWNFGALTFRFVDGTGNNDIAIGASEFYGGGNLAYTVERDALVALRVTGGGGTATIQAYANGARIATAPAANPGVGAGTTGIKLGGDIGFGLASVAGVQGACYLDGTVTDAQIQAHAEACMVAGGVVDGGIAWTHRWDQTGAPGAIWADQVGSGDLTRNGAPGVATRRLRLA